MSEVPEWVGGRAGARSGSRGYLFQLCLTGSPDQEVQGLALSGKWETDTFLTLGVGEGRDVSMTPAGDCGVQRELSQMGTPSSPLPALSPGLVILLFPSFCRGRARMLWGIRILQRQWGAGVKECG